jgi:hypothetical protein
LKAFESDKRLTGATWDKVADHFPDPDIFTLIVDMPDPQEILFFDLRGFRSWLAALLLGSG